MAKRLFPVLLIVAAILLTACGGETVIEEEPVVPVAVGTAEHGQVVQWERLSGVLAAQEQVYIVPQLGGQIEAVNVSTGDRVKTGQVLVRLQTSDLLQQIYQAQAGVEAAEAQLNRALAGASEEELIQLQAAVTQAETGVEAVLLNLYAYLDDFSPGHQQLVGAETQYRQARLAREQAENQLYQVAHGSGAEQVEMGVDQARKARDLLKEGIDSLKGRLKTINADIKKLEELGKELRELTGEDDGERRAEIIAEMEKIEGRLDIEAKMELEAKLKGLETEYEMSKYQVDSAELARRQLQLETREQAELALRQAEAAEVAALQQLEMARKGLTQQEQLVLGQNRQAEAGLEAAKARLKQAKAGAREEDLQAAEAGVKQAKAALGLARSQAEKNIIKAPISGQVTALQAQVGELAGPSQPLLAVVNSDMVKVEFNVTERLINHIAIGDEVKVRLASLPEDVFTAVITAIPPAVDPRTRVFTVEAILENEAGLLKPGLFADVELVTAVSSDDVPLLPLQALLREQGDNYIYVVEDDRAVKRKVTLGLSDDRWVEVLSGMEKGDRYVQRGQHYLEDGMKVKVSQGPGGESP